MTNFTTEDDNPATISLPANQLNNLHPQTQPEDYDGSVRALAE